MREFFEWLESLKSQQGQVLTDELIGEITEQVDILLAQAGREGYELAKEDIIETINRLQ